MLTIELVPSTCWFSNVRSQVSKEDWDKIRKACYKKANYRCQICDEVGPTHPVECHEIFEYEDESHYQVLTGMIALCPDCHLVKHIGRAQLIGRYDYAISHLMRINSWSKDDANLYVQHCFEVWSKRSQFPWQLDLSYLDKQGIAYNARPALV